jgi:hypothetical protein
MDLIPAEIQKKERKLPKNSNNSYTAISGVESLNTLANKTPMIKATPNRSSWKACKGLIVLKKEIIEDVQIQVVKPSSKIGFIDLSPSLHLQIDLKKMFCWEIETIIPVLIKITY